MKESDWKLFRRRVPEWRERYLGRKNREITATLTREDRTPTEAFWEAHAQIDREAKTLVDCFDGHSRGRLPWFLLLMHAHGVIGDADLEGFSEELRQTLQHDLGEVRRAGGW